MQSQNPRSLQVGEKIKNFAYNFKYKALALLEEYPLEEALSPYQTIYLLGKQYTSNPANNTTKNKEFAQHFRNVLWITYRSGFPELLKDYGYDYCFVTDTGWGCMIRVGQMLFAEILKNYLKPKEKEEYNQICDFFNDFRPDALFSIQKIARVGKHEFNLVPGEWYNPAQIAYILSGFLNESKEKKLSDLKALVFNNSSFFYDQVLQKFNPSKMQPCLHKSQSKMICTECYRSNRKVAVIILVRLGLHSPEPEYLEILNILMTWKWFRGIIGGKPEKALYFIGIKDNRYIYLDPHYVQTAKENISQHNFSYFCQSLRLCKNTSTDPSLGICFYLQSLEDLNELYNSMKKLKEQQSSGFFIFLSDETPEYMTKQKQYTYAKDIQDSGQFQVI